MKPIASAIESAALRQAIEQFEASRETQGAAPGTPQEAPGTASKARGKAHHAKPSGTASTAKGEARSLERARALQRTAEADQLEALARKAGVSPEAAAQIANGLRAQAPNEWTFIMLSASQNAAVVRWLSTNSSRTVVALNLWARLFEIIRNDTGEVMASRSELAAHLGVEPRTLSELMTELASINAIRRERNGRGVRYFMNSNVATHLPGNAARKLARETDGPVLAVVHGGKAS